MQNEMKLYKEQVETATAWLREKIDFTPEVILVLGTGLGSIADLIEDSLVLPYEEIPHFPRSTVTSHAGNLIFGLLGTREIAVLQGRFHFYEGYSTRELTFPVRVLSLLGPEYLFVSNAAGGLNPTFAPGTLMVVEDHLNFILDNPLRGPNVDEWGVRFPDFSQTYDPHLRQLAHSCAARLGMTDVVGGTYVAIPGPSLETPAETRFLRNCGADAVGMSTVPEVIVAVHAGLKVLGISMVSNVNDPDDFKPIILEEILAQAKIAESRFQKLVVEILKEL